MRPDVILMKWHMYKRLLTAILPTRVEDLPSFLPPVWDLTTMNDLATELLCGIISHPVDTWSSLTADESDDRQATNQSLRWYTEVNGMYSRRMTDRF